MTGQNRPWASWFRRWSAPLVAPTALATGLALYDLTARSLWLDEGSTFAAANQHGAALWHLLVSAGGNFFFYYPLMHVLVSIFGSSLLVLRLPSALAAIATVPIAAVLLTRLFDRRAAIVGTWFLVLSGPLVFWSQQARGYSFAVFFVMAAALGLVNALAGSRRGWWVFAGCGWLAIANVLLAGFAIAALAGSVLLRDRRTVAWRMWTAAVAAIGVGCVPLAVLVIHRGTSGLDWLGKPGTTYGPANAYLLKFLLSAETVGMPVTFVSVAILILMLALLLVGAARLGWRLRRSGRDSASDAYQLLAAWLVVPPVIAYAFSVLVQPVITDRYILTSVPAASMLAGVIVSRLRPPLLSAGLAVVMALALGYQLRPSYAVPLENWSGAESYVADHSAPGDCIAFFVSDGYDAVDFYVTTRAPQTFPTPVLPATPFATPRSYALDPAVLTPAALQHAIASCPRLWLLRSHVVTNRPAAGTPKYRVLTFTRYTTLVSQLAASFQREPTTQHFTDITVELYRPRS